MRILIADDTETIRRGIAAFLCKVPDWTICGEASDGNQAIQKTRQLLPDLVLLDIHMPSTNAFEITRVLRHEFPGIKVLIMSADDGSLLRNNALAAGADGCIDKACLAKQLIPAIKDLETGLARTAGRASD